MIKDIGSRLMSIRVMIGMILIISIHFRLTAQEGTLFEPPDGIIYHGVGWGSNAQIEYSSIFSPQNRPLLFQSIFGIPGNPQRPLTVARIFGMLRPDHIDPDQQFTELSVQFAEADDKILDSLFAFTDSLDHYIDTLAQALNIHDRPIFLRIGLEMNGAWNGYTPWIFPQAFRKLVEELRYRQVENVATVWCYEPDAQPDYGDSTEAGWKWYPGDDVVDWFGLDLFDADHFHPDLPDSNGNRLTKKGRSEAFLQFAEQRGKPVYLNELSARGVNIVPDENDPDSTQGKQDWMNWFDPFFRFLDLHPNVKALNYIDLDWTQIPKYVGWGDARIEINGYIKNQWIDKLTDSRFLHIGTDIRNPNTGVAPGNGKASQREEDIRISISPNPFNESTLIRYSLPEERDIHINVYNLLGKQLDTIYAGRQKAGIHSFFWETSRLSSGVYLIVLQTKSDRRTSKAILLK